MKLAAIILCVSVLTGCSMFSTQKPVSLPALVSEEIVTIDSELLEPCKALVPVPESATLDSVLQDTLPGTILAYGECANRQKSSLLVIKRLANIK